MIIDIELRQYEFVHRNITYQVVWYRRSFDNQPIVLEVLPIESANSAQKVERFIMDVYYQKQVFKYIQTHLEETVML